MRTIAIHQPNYLPWLGFFYKIFLSDIFVFLDDVEFTKRSFTRRVHIRKEKKSIQKRYLIVPLQKHSDASLIKDLLMDHRQDWQTRQLNQVFNTYSKAPFFEETFFLFSSWMEASRSFTSLAAFNEYLIKAVSRMISCRAAFRKSSDCLLQDRENSVNLQLVQHLQGQIYLSGQGGKKYQEESMFREAGIELQYSDVFHYLERQRYTQAQGPWLNGLSVVDALMNIGAPGISALFRRFQEEELWGV